MDWRAGFPFFCLLMALAFVSVALVKVDETKVAEPPEHRLQPQLAEGTHFFRWRSWASSCTSVRSSRMGRFLKPALQDSAWTKRHANKFGPTVFYLLLTVGRLLGGRVLTVMSPRTCFRLSAFLGVLGAGALMTGSKPLALAGIVAAGLGFANIWPMLFSITVEEKPDAPTNSPG